MTPWLKQNSQTADLLEVLSSAEVLLGQPAALFSRTVAVRTQGKWYNHVTKFALLPKEEAVPQHPEVDLGEVFLLDGVLDLQEPLTRDDLRKFLTVWRERVGAPQGFELDDGIGLSRDSPEPPLRPFPRWTGSLNEATDDRGNWSFPAGPFIDPSHDLFAPDVPTLTAYWLGDPALKEQRYVRHDYLFELEDRRGRIAGLEAEGNSLTVTTEGVSMEELQCGASITTHSGLEIQYLQPVIDGRAGFIFDYPVRDLDVWLMLPAGHGLDNYRESPSHASWGRGKAIYNRPPPLSDAHLRDLSQALDGGEDSHTEFKPFIRLRPRDAKATELLETTSAFSNGQGGLILLGVTDYGEPVGPKGILQKAYGQECKRDLECQKVQYEKDLLRLFNEGLIPPVAPEFRWYEVAHEPVLQISIHRAPSPTYLIESGEVFRRVGATNKKLRPADEFGADTQSPWGNL
jgi:hypothetical protein